MKIKLHLQFAMCILQCTIFTFFAFLHNSMFACSHFHISSFFTFFDYMFLHVFTFCFFHCIFLTFFDFFFYNLIFFIFSFFLELFFFWKFVFVIFFIFLHFFNSFHFYVFFFLINIFLTFLHVFLMFNVICFFWHFCLFFSPKKCFSIFFFLFFCHYVFLFLHFYIVPKFHVFCYFLQFANYNLQFTIYIVHFTMYNLQCTIYNVHFYTVRCTMSMIQCPFNVTMLQFYIFPTLHIISLYIFYISFFLQKKHHEVNNEVWGIRKHGTETKSSQCTGSVASDAGNQSPEQVCKKESCEKLARHAFHEINVALFGSRGTSSANSLSSGSSRVSIPRFARFREDSNSVSCINFQRKPRRTNSSQGARAASESFVTTWPSCAAERHQRIIVPHSTRLSLSASASRTDFLSFRSTQEDGERARAS